jgi:polyphosphate kinase
VRALVEAASKKEVAVVVELKARFDEASNIRWARNLQEAGVQVYYGVVGLKTHCKLALVARRESDGQIRRYAHLGTGNYNPSTARLYTDLAAHARAGRPAFIVAKVNALLDEKIIQALYRASQAGVKIELIVRGACALRPGLPGISSRIRVRSVIGRFLEHSRIFVFGNGGRTEVYLGSADWMHRNIYERVEVMFHLRNAALCNQILRDAVGPYLADTEKTRILLPDGEYVRARQARASLHSRNGFHFNAQEFLLESAQSANPSLEAPPLPNFLKLPALKSEVVKTA